MVFGHRGEAMVTTLEPRLHNMALAIARSFMRRLPRNVQLEDLEQAAVIGLLDGLRRHPEGEGQGFDWYLRTRIRGAVLDELRAQDWSSRRRSGRLPPPRTVHLDDARPLWADMMAGTSEDPEQVAIRRLDAAKAWRSPINHIDHRILHARYARGVRQDDVAAEEKLSAPRISQREQRGLEGMRRFLEDGPW